MYNFRAQLKKCKESKNNNTFESIFKDRPVKEYKEVGLTSFCDKKINYYKTLRTKLINDYRINMFSLGSKVLLEDRDGEIEGEVVEVKKTGVVFHTTKVNYSDWDETEFITFNELLKSDHIYIMKSEDK